MWSKRRAVRPVTLELLKARESIEKMARCVDDEVDGDDDDDDDDDDGGGNI